MERSHRIALALLVTVALLPAGRSTSAEPTWWQPTPGTSWQIQLNGSPDITVDAEVFDVDLFDTPQGKIDALHERDRRVICSFSAGSREKWRPDADRFPAKAVGKPLDGWPGERWLDVRSDAVRRIMRQRLDLAVEKGCDAVDPDNVDGYTQDTGFPLRAADQLDYNRFLAAEAHQRSLAVGLKNDVEQIPQLIDAVDFTVNEECFKYRECDAVAAFVEAGKPVFQIEYGGSRKARQICPKATAAGFETLIKRLALDEWRIVCAERQGRGSRPSGRLERRS